MTGHRVAEAVLQGPAPATPPTVPRHTPPGRYPPGCAQGGPDVVPRIRPSNRGFVRISLDGLVALIRHLATHLDIGPPAAMALAGEVLVLLVDVADPAGQVAPVSGWDRADRRTGYQHRLISRDGWQPRLRQLTDAGVVAVDERGRLVGLSRRWHTQLTSFEDRRDGEDAARTVPSAVVQRAALRDLVEHLRDLRDARGRTRSGIGRLLTLAVLLCCSRFSRERGYVTVTQRELASLLGLRLATVNAQVQRLAEAELLVPAERHRGQHASTEHLAWIGELSDRLAGREWVLVTEAAVAADPAPTRAAEQPHNPRQHCSGSTTGAVPVPPPPEVGFLRGSVSSGSPSSGHTGRPTETARGGFHQTVTTSWVCGPSTDNAYTAWTISAVAGLRHTVRSLRDILSAYADKADGRQVRAALEMAIERAAEELGRWQKTGQLPCAEDRDLIDALARLARRCDQLMEGSPDWPPASVAAAFCDEDPPGDMTSLRAVLLLAGRLPSQHHRSHGPGGRWRTRTATRLGHDRPTRPGLVPDAVASVAAALSAHRTEPQPEPPPDARQRAAAALVDQVSVRAAGGDVEARAIASRWMEDAAAWWVGDPPAQSLSDPQMRRVITAWVAAEPRRAREVVGG